MKLWPHGPHQNLHLKTIKSHTENRQKVRTVTHCQKCTWCILNLFEDLPSPPSPSFNLFQREGADSAPASISGAPGGIRYNGRPPGISSCGGIWAEVNSQLGAGRRRRCNRSLSVCMAAYSPLSCPIDNPLIPLWSFFPLPGKGTSGGQWTISTLFRSRSDIRVVQGSFFCPIIVSTSISWASVKG